ncbi:cysteine peptidase family C39 domain-containing protein [Cohnella sp. GCM10027633]|uniref:cysteine peptidase family C39 domain-containing protein n=1 Tax=unclassified Cohnella TaxID=2636738 RepID=UPI00363B6C46
MNAVDFPQSASITDSGGLKCLIIVANYHGIRIDVEQIKHAFAVDEDNIKVADLVKIARSTGLKSKSIHTDMHKLPKLRLPSIVLLTTGEFIVIAKQVEAGFLVFNPKIGKPTTIATEAFSESWTGEVMLFTPTTKDAREREFGVKWFFPVIWKYKRILTEVLVASLFIQILGLVSPLTTQVIIDKVFAHHGGLSIILCKLSYGNLPRGGERSSYGRYWPIRSG